MNLGPEPITRRIAVIAIHGVGDHLPREMAEAAADMLESRKSGGGQNLYTGFEEETVRIHVEPVKICPLPPALETPKGLAWGPMDRMRLSGRKSKKQVRSAADTQKDSIDHLFMEAQLTGYKSQGAEDIYECLRMGSTRKAGTGFPEKLVHVYDMFWSDLSGVNKSGLRVFGELYQLLFHLGSVGVVNVAAAATFFRERDNQVASKWDTFTRCQKCAAGALAYPIALINLILLALALIVFIVAAMARVTVTGQAILGAIALFVALAIAWANCLRKKPDSSIILFRAPLIFALIASTLAIAGILCADDIWWGGPQIVLESAQGIVSLLLLLLAWLGLGPIVDQYELRRKGVRSVFIILSWGIVLIGAVSAWIYPPFGSDGRLNVALVMLIRFAEVGFWLLILSWLFFWVGMASAAIAGWLAVRAVARSKAVSGEEDRARRTNRTALLTVALPSTIFLLVTFAGWSGLLHEGLPLLPQYAEFNAVTSPQDEIQNHCASLRDTLCYSPLPVLGHKAAEPARSWASDSFSDAGALFMPIVLLLTAVATLIVLYAVVPSAADEVFPPSGANCKDAEALGNWLSKGFDFMRWAQFFLWFGVLLFPALTGIGMLSPDWLKRLTPHLQPFAETMGALVAGTATGLLAFGGRFSSLALGLRTGVRVALDVDNWLRESPEGTNPTAKICARYVSLLRYLGQWRDESGKPYDAVVIFAHSQGTVITADLLRFLNVEQNNAFLGYDNALPCLRDMNIHLLTVGCPLRQLYGLRFPYIYGYAQNAGAQTPLPNPSDLAVVDWTNAYRTGDYVGRYLWRGAGFWDPNQPFSLDACTEFTIGPGAHTHYWDHTAEQVADTLDSIIARV